MIRRRCYAAFLSTLIGALSAVSSCAFAYIAPEELERGLKECTGQNLNTLRCAKAIEAKVLAAGHKVVKRSEDRLSIQTDKNAVNFIDKPSGDGDDSTSYSYLGYNKSIGSHILHVQKYEGASYLVINGHSGEMAYASGFPTASPDHKHFLSISMDMFSGYSPNSVEIWDVTSTGFRKLFTLAPQWGPQTGKWLDAHQVQVEKICFAPSEKDPAALAPCGQARVIRSGSAWKLIE